jgi:rsbT co-antagonist protein RsbR
MEDYKTLAHVLSSQQDKIQKEWLAHLKAAGVLAAGGLKEGELNEQARSFLDLLMRTVQSGRTDQASEKALRDMLGNMSRTRALQGFSPTETATFVFSLKQPLFEALKRELKTDAGALADAIWGVTKLIDSLGLYTAEVFIQSREDVVARQHREIAELSTPVVKLWDGILALPLIGTLDSERTSVVMENLLQSLIDHAADYAIIDITGVPTVDTLVAQHLLKTVSAARLMGADCIISGIRPQIAQTMVHLGVELNVQSKATLADAFREALHKTGRTVSRTGQSKAAARIPE